jgi:DASS family divalent anion:Na+ symporter
MFLTAMAANPLLQSLSYKEGIEITWASWALGAIVPGIISLILMPLLIYVIHPPAIKHSPQAPKMANEALKNMGRISFHEMTMIVVFVALIIGWILDKKIGLDATSVAMFGVVTLLVTGVLEWNDAIHEKAAWDSFIWFAIMVMLSGYLAEFGTIKWIGLKIGESLKHYPAVIAVPLLMLIYFYLHYLFASATAHATVLFSTFLLLILSFGTNPMLAAMSLVYLTSLSGGLTHYGIATAPIYYGSKAVSTKQWWTIGLLVSILNLAIWGIIGGIWWKYLGWF